MFPLLLHFSNIDLACLHVNNWHNQTGLSPFPKYSHRTTQNYANNTKPTPNHSQYRAARVQRTRRTACSLGRFGLYQRCVLRSWFLRSREKTMDRCKVDGDRGGARPVCAHEQSVAPSGPGDAEDTRSEGGCEHEWVGEGGDEHHRDKLTREVLQVQQRWGNRTSSFH